VLKALSLATGGEFTGIVWVSKSVSPSLSVTVSVTVYVPAVAYVWLGSTPLPLGLLSPKSQEYEAMKPSGSDDEEASKSTVRPEAVNVKLAEGGSAIAGVTRSAAIKSRKEVRNIIALVFI
jgi:hypothetical protein